MFVLQLSFLYGVAIAASLTVLITMCASLTLLPALMGFMGTHVLESTRAPQARGERSRTDRARTPPGSAGPIPSRSTRASSRSWRSSPSCSSASPSSRLHLGSSDAGTDPAGSTTRQAYDLLAQGFGPGFNGPLQVVGAIHNAKDEATMQALDEKLQGKPDIATVGAAPDLPERQGRGHLRRAQVQSRTPRSPRTSSRRSATSTCRPSPPRPIPRSTSAA